MGKKNYYAIYFLDNGKSAVIDEWATCQKLIKGRSNHYQGFSTKSEAEMWLTSEKATFEKFPQKPGAEKHSPSSKAASEEAPSKPKVKKRSPAKKDAPKKDFAEFEEEHVVYKSEEDRQSKVYLSYKDKPVNGDPSDKQINYLKVLCKNKGLKMICIGMTKKEASSLISYFLGEEEKKPSCYKKYIIEKP